MELTDIYIIKDKKSDKPGNPILLENELIARRYLKSLLYGATREVCNDLYLLKLGTLLYDPSEGIYFKNDKGYVAITYEEVNQ